ncbi:hypothetical protein Q8A67_003868 [Cirrhinus molitorella]|uniref:Arrestin C-terminal-like domain-containing protein n=1 Tax=Cirrhinus molitorella TaxID=172907 RepID=A0AA88Q1F8_9TELE|nr:hypothetical protein Q8A67_003868 [Cirrhinus molitorella]
MGSKWASYMGPTWVTQLRPTWVNPGSLKKNALTNQITRKDAEKAVSKWLIGARDRGGYRNARARAGEQNGDHESYFKLKQYFIQESSKREQSERNTTLLYGETYGPLIRPGRHVFPFRFQLPQQNMPPSFNGYLGWVKYVLTVKLSRTWKSSAASKELTFVLRNDGTNDHLLQPQSGTQDKKIKLFGSGQMSMTVTTDKTGYMQGETIRVFVEIDNSSSRDVKLKYSLKQQQTFVAGERTKAADKLIVKNTRDLIPSGEKSKFIVNLILPHDLTVTIKNCRIIKVQYILKVPFSPPVGFQSYPPPQPNLVPYPGELPGLYNSTVLPHPRAAAGVYPNPNAFQPGFHLAPSAPVYHLNQSTKESSPKVPY